MMTRGRVDINNPQGGNVTTQPGFALGRRRLADEAASNYTQPPIFDYAPPALQRDQRFADYMQGMIQANPATPRLLWHRLKSAELQKPNG